MKDKTPPPTVDTLFGDVPSRPAPAAIAAAMAAGFARAFAAGSTSALGPQPSTPDPLPGRRRPVEPDRRKDDTGPSDPDVPAGADDPDDSGDTLDGGPRSANPTPGEAVLVHATARDPGGKRAPDAVPHREPEHGSAFAANPGQHRRRLPAPTSG
jgi:hypothetical protein